MAKNKNDNRTFTQYSEYGGGFLPSSRTIETIPPGMYDVEVSQVGIYLSPRSVVTDNLLRLPDSKSDEVIREIDEFWARAHLFKKYGFTHKRGFLLHGPPGSGKTVTLALIAQRLVESGGTVIIGQSTSPRTLTRILKQFREIEPDRPLVVLLEDIDTIIENYGEQEVLALLDGEASIDHVVYVATTNYPENLDGRIINRPSRFDKIVKIGMPNAEARALYLKSRGVEGDIMQWVEMTNNFSIAHLKEVVISVACFGNDLTETIERVRNMVNTPDSTSDDDSDDDESSLDDDDE